MLVEKEVQVMSFLSGTLCSDNRYCSSFSLLHFIPCNGLRPEQKKRMF